MDKMGLRLAKEWKMCFLDDRALQDSVFTSLILGEAEGRCLHEVKLLIWKCRTYFHYHLC